MPISKENGFTALIVPYPNQGNDIPTALPEFKVSQSANIIECYFIAEPYLSFRVYFARCTEVGELECYLAVVDFDGTSVCKAYGIGEGVIRNEGDNPWHLSSQLTEAVDLSEVGKKVIELKLVRTKIKEGVPLGNGELLVQDFEFIDDREFVLFRWFWCTPNQAVELRLDSTMVDHILTSTITINSINAFISAKEKLLMSLLTVEQQITFLSELITSSSTSVYLSQAHKSLINETRKKLQKKLAETQLSESFAKSGNGSGLSVDSRHHINEVPVRSLLKSPFRIRVDTQITGNENQKSIFNVQQADRTRSTSSSSSSNTASRGPFPRSPVRSNSINNSIRSPSPHKSRGFTDLLASYETCEESENVSKDIGGKKVVGEISEQEEIRWISGTIH